VNKRRLAVVTGATRGLGLAIARRLAQDGFTPILNYAHDEPRARAALTEVRTWSRDAALVRADVTDEAGAERLIREAAGRGQIQLLVNNVGDFLRKPLLETTLDEWQSVLATNLTSAFLCSKAVLPRLREAGAGQIIFVGAMHVEVLRAVPNTVPYTIAKTGLLVLAKSLAKIEGRHGVRVNAVDPGLMEGGADGDLVASVPLGRLGRPEEVAAAVSFLASDAAAYITGAVLSVHGGAFL